MKKNILLILTAISVLSCTTNSQQVYTSGEVVAGNDTCKAIDTYLTQLAADKNFSGGLLIIKDGKKIFSKGYGWANKETGISFTPATLASIGSITKAFTAAAIMKLVEQGKLSVNEKIKKFFPNIPDDKAAITIHQLLTHSSGFHEFLQNDGGDFEKLETEEFLKRAFNEPLSFKPGEKAVYTNVGMSILAIIVEKISGTGYEAFLNKNLFEPIGIKHIGYCYPSLKEDIIAHGYQNGKDWGTHQLHFDKAGGGPYWNLKGNGGLEASLNDMFLWANAFTNHSILQDTTIAKMFTRQIPEEGYGGKSWFGYGCNISTSRRNTTMIDNGGSNGIYFARLIRLPKEGVVFYMVTNESIVNTNKVLPNITQLYFQGSITQDALTAQSKFENPVSKTIYDIITATKTTNLALELDKAKITVEDDMILLEVGQKLIEEQKTDEALALYQFYTTAFPNIVVAWNDMGDVYLLKHNKDEAIKCYRQALKIRPENARAKENLKKLMN